MSSAANFLKLCQTFHVTRNIQSPLNFKGGWNATTNTPTITSGAGMLGDQYIVNVAGNTTIDGENDWNVGDWLVFNGTVWQKYDASLNVANTTTLWANSTGGSDANGTGTVIAPYATPKYASLQIPDAAISKQYLINAQGVFSNDKLILRPYINYSFNNSPLTITDSIVLGSGWALGGNVFFEDCVLTAPSNISLDFSNVPSAIKLIFRNILFNASTTLTIKGNGQSEFALQQGLSQPTGSISVDCYDNNGALFSCATNDVSIRNTGISDSVFLIDSSEIFGNVLIQSTGDTQNLVVTKSSSLFGTITLDGANVFWITDTLPLSGQIIYLNGASRDNIKEFSVMFPSSLVEVRSEGGNDASADGTIQQPFKTLGAANAYIKTQPLGAVNYSVNAFGTFTEPSFEALPNVSYQGNNSSLTVTGAVTLDASWGTSAGNLFMSGFSSIDFQSGMTLDVSTRPGSKIIFKDCIDSSTAITAWTITGTPSSFFSIQNSLNGITPLSKINLTLNNINARIASGYSNNFTVNQTGGGSIRIDAEMNNIAGTYNLVSSSGSVLLLDRSTNLIGSSRLIKTTGSGSIIAYITGLIDLAATTLDGTGMNVFLDKFKNEPTYLNGATFDNNISLLTNAKSISEDHPAVNYTPTDDTVDGHIDGIDTALGTKGSGTVTSVDASTTSPNILIGGVPINISGVITVNTDFQSSGFMTGSNSVRLVGRSFLGTANQINVTNQNGFGGNPVISIVDNAVLPGTGGVTLPKGTTVQRAGAAGTVRFNTQTSTFEETTDGSTWKVPAYTNTTITIAGDVAGSGTIGSTINVTLAQAITRTNGQVYNYSANPNCIHNLTSSAAPNFIFQFMQTLNTVHSNFSSNVAFSSPTPVSDSLTHSYTANGVGTVNWLSLANLYTQANGGAIGTATFGCDVILNRNPQVALGAATKQYVDSVLVNSAYGRMYIDNNAATMTVGTTDSIMTIGVTGIDLNQFQIVGAGIQYIGTSSIKVSIQGYLSLSQGNVLVSTNMRVLLYKDSAPIIGTTAQANAQTSRYVSIPISATVTLAPNEIIFIYLNADSSADTTIKYMNCVVSTI